MGTMTAHESGNLGIEKIRIYPTTMSLDISKMCDARAMDAQHVQTDFLIDQRGINPPWEDAVTMAVNAANSMLTDEDREAIRLLIVGTETAVDQEKPVSSWVHRFLKLSSHCRNFEVKHACYAATGGLQMALSWLASPMAGNQKALIISADQSLISIGEAHEHVTGAGAAAVLLSKQPRLIAYELGKNGIYAAEVSDVIRPTPRVETGNGGLSLVSYFDALEAAYQNYTEQLDEDINFNTYFDWNLYHMPFAGIAYRAHRALVLMSGNYSKQETREFYQQKTEPTTHFARLTGGTYGATTFVGLLGLAATASGFEAGQRLGIFAYGSGSCAEFYSAIVMPEAADVAQEAGLEKLMADRYSLSIEEYESIETIRDQNLMAADFIPDRNICGDWYKRRYEEQGHLVLNNVTGHYRHYEWS